MPNNFLTPAEVGRHILAPYLMALAADLEANPVPKGQTRVFGGIAGDMMPITVSGGDPEFPATLRKLAASLAGESKPKCPPAPNSRS